jgi:GntR family transcriptional repressor for pyruvate dehydrogenase complex
MSSSPTFRPARRTSLAEDITEQLLQLVVEGRFPEDHLPSERELCEQLNVSRGPVREAVSTLQHLGVVELRGRTRHARRDRAIIELLSRGSGTGGAERLVDEPMEARRMIEPPIAGLAAARASDADATEISQWVDRMEHAAAAGESGIEYDSAFHVAVANATGNQILAKLVAALTESLRESRTLSFRPPESAAVAVAGHRAVVEALRAHDPEAARAAMERHLDEVEALVRAALSSAAD